MPGPLPNTKRRRRNVPARGDWTATSGIGWQHGPTPKTPDGLLAASREAWAVWFASWFAARWTPDLLPGLRQAVRLYDQVERGEFQRAAELRMTMDTYGMTPKGAAQLHWTPPKDVSAGADPVVTAADDPYAKLRVVS